MRLGDAEPLKRVLEASTDFPQNLLKFYGPGESHYRRLCARVDGQIVGVLSGSFDSDFFESGAFDAFDLPPAPHAFLDRVHVHESARGAGAGKALVMEYARQAEGHGCTFIGGSIDLSSDAGGRRAFFERLGFTIRAHDNFGAMPSRILTP
ncbi:GNAT family N-acetyltransferase [Nocardioides bruguierae]|uniref:GNAT family N-acetyltransferase n=1 Tax=Nocardioides bruguierae TaxID=2945102 RepID=UPI00201FC3F9|nr:GNAT family N-acetyltransferase [Nocardioides bruguierae]